jgi:hypothetical protein
VNSGFTITENARLGLRCALALEGMYVLSPFVWPERGGHRALLRLVNRDCDPHTKISRIHAARSRDGLLFDSSEEPVLAPGPDREDAQGAEDPIVIAGADETVVYDSGWDQANERSTLLYARGSSVETLSKCGVAIAQSATRANPKEAAFARASDGSCSWHDGTVSVDLGTTQTIEGTRICVATGRVPRTRGFGLEETGAAIDEYGRITVDDQCRLVEGVYAVGDVAGNELYARRKISRPHRRRGDPRFARAREL